MASKRRPRPCGGYVVVRPGARGRDDVASDGTYYGVAPAAIVDLKAAVRYVRHNTGRIPGDTDRIVSSGTSAGGALSTLLGASGYAVWHHLRRLRRRLGEQHTTRLQDLNVRCHVTAAASYLDWLADRERALADCTQADLDWTVGGHRYRDETAHFGRWAVTHRQTTGLTFDAIRHPGHSIVARAVYRNLPSLAAARASYPEVTAPVHLIYGDKDWSRPANRQADRRVLPDAEFTQVPTPAASSPWNGRMCRLTC